MIYLNGVEVKFEKFPNNEIKLNCPINLDNVQTITLKWLTNDDLFSLGVLKRHVDKDRYLRRTINLIIYYMPYSRMDRTEGNTAFTLKYACKLINDMDFDTVTVCEPHSDVTCALLDRSEALPITERLFKRGMRNSWFDFNHKLDFVCFPDAGAEKSYSNIGDFNKIIGMKSRDWETGHINRYDMYNTTELSMVGRRAIIIDDLCSKGGTFIYAANELRKRGITEVYLLTTHCEYSIFAGDLLKDGSPVDHVFTTNTIINTEYAEDNLSVYDIKRFTYTY